MLFGFSFFSNDVEPKKLLGAAISADSECEKGPLSEKCPDENEICRSATGKYHGVQNWSAENLPCLMWDDPEIGHVYYGKQSAKGLE